MNLTRCPQGHFYDADTNASCPHCAQGNVPGNDQSTVAVNRNASEDSATQSLTSALGGGTVTQTGSNATGTKVTPKPADDNEKTVSYSQAKIGSEPVVGWLVCTEGEHMGEDFRLKTGKNFIGRSTSMDAALTKDKSVSRDKHAIVLYEPKSHIFLVQPGEARELCYLNDQVILSAQEIKRNDVITVGESKLMFFPCCDAVFNWDMVKKEEEK